MALQDELESIKIELKAVGQDAAVKQIEAAIKRISDAQKQANKLEQDLAKAREKATAQQAAAADRQIANTERAVQAAAAERDSVDTQIVRIKEKLRLFEEEARRLQEAAQAEDALLQSRVQREESVLETQRATLKQQLANLEALRAREEALSQQRESAESARAQRTLAADLKRTQRTRAELERAIQYQRSSIAAVEGNLNVLRQRQEAADKRSASRAVASAQSRVNLLLQVERDLNERRLQLERRYQETVAALERQRQARSSATQQATSPRIAALENDLKRQRQLLAQLEAEAQESVERIRSATSEKPDTFAGLLESLTPERLKNFAAEAENLGQVFTRLGQATSSAELGAAGAALRGIASAGAPIAAGALAITGLGVALQQLVSISKQYVAQAADYVRSQDNVVKITGASRENVAGLVEAFKLVNGNAKDVADVLGQLSQATNEAARGSQIAREQFALLGVTNFDNLNIVLKQLDENFNKIPDSIRKTAALTSLFGEEGARQLTPLLGRISEFTQLARETGLVIDDTVTDSLRKFSETTLALEATLQGLINAVGGELAGDFTALNKTILEIVKTLKNDENFVSGLKVLGGLLGSVVAQFKNFVIITAAAASGVSKVIGFIGDALRPQRHLNEAIDEYQKSLAVAALQTNALAKATADASRVLEGLFRKTGIVAEQNEAAIQAITAAVQAEVEVVEDAIRRQVISAEDGAQRIAALRQREVQAASDLRAEELRQLVTATEQQIAVNQEKYRKFAEQAEAARRLEEQAEARVEQSEQQQLAERLRLEEQFNAQLVAARERLAAARSTIDRNEAQQALATLEERSQREISALLQRQALELRVERDTLAALIQQRRRYQTQAEAITEEIRQLNVVLGREEIQQQDFNNKALLDKRRELVERRTALAQLETERLQAQLALQQQLEQAAAAAKTRRLDEIARQEEEQSAEAASRRARDLTAQSEYELELLRIQQDALQQRLAAQDAYIERLRSLDLQNVELLRQAENERTNIVRSSTEQQLQIKVRAAERLISLAQRERDASRQRLELETASIESSAAQQIASIEELINARKRQGAVEDEITRLSLQQAQLRIQTEERIIRLQLANAQAALDVLQQTAQKLLQQNATQEQQLQIAREIADVKSEILRLEGALATKSQERRQAELDALDTLRRIAAASADITSTIFDANAALERSNETLRSSASLAGLLAQALENAEQKATDTASAISEIGRLQDWLAQLEQQFGQGGIFDPQGIAAVIAAKIQTEILEAKDLILREQAELLEPLFERQRELREKEREELNELFSEYQQKLADLDTNLRRARKQAKKEIAEVSAEAAEAESEAYQELQEDLVEIAESGQKRIEQLKEKYREQDLEATRKLEEKKRKAAQDAAEDAIAGELDYLQTRRDILDKIAELEKQAADKTLSQEQRKKLALDLAEAQKELAKIDEKNSRRIEREKRKQAAIDKARAQATSAEELEILLDKIEAEFDAEEELDRQLEELGENATEREKQRVKELIEAKKQLRLKELENEAEILKASQAQREADRARELAELEQEIKDRVNERQKEYEQDKANREKALQERIDQIKANLEAEKREFAIQRIAIENEYKASMARIQAEAQRAWDEVQKQIDETEKRFQQLFRNIEENIGKISQQLKASQLFSGGNTPPATSQGSTTGDVSFGGGRRGSTIGRPDTGAAGSDTAYGRLTRAATTEIPEKPTGKSRLSVAKVALDRGFPAEFKRTSFNQEIIDKIPSRTDEELQQLRANYQAALASAPNVETRDNYLQVLEAIDAELARRAKPQPGTGKPVSTGGTLEDKPPLDIGAVPVPPPPVPVPPKTPTTGGGIERFRPPRLRAADEGTQNATAQAGAVSINIAPNINVTMTLSKTTPEGIGTEAAQRILDVLQSALRDGISAQADRLLETLTDRLDERMGRRLRQRGLRLV